MSVVDRIKRALGGLITRSPHQRLSRALLKTMMYRTLMIVITIVVAFVFTGSTGDALSIGIVSNAIKTGTYYGYERLWDRIAWGVDPGGE